MNSLHNGARYGGLPRWVLLAASPLVLILGVVTGVAVSAYWPSGTAEPTPPVVTENPADPTAEPPNTGAETPDQTPPQPSSEPSDPAKDTPAQETVGLLPPPFDFWTYPTGNASAGTDEPARTGVKTLVDARAVLSAEYHTFTADGRELFQVDYQLARDKNYETMLVGIVKIADYSQWVEAATEYPDQLGRWLRAAAQRVQQAALTDGFTLSWAIFEVVTDRPFGFLASEVTPTPKGDGYLVTRPLAAVTDVARSSVSIASTNIGTGPQTSPTQPSNVYGPVLRFDPTDLYRPTQRP